MRSKLVDRLGSNDAIPVEVIPFGWQATERRLKELHGNPILRKREDGENYMTDGGHYILDCKFGPLAKAMETEQKLNNVVGVVEHGLFLGMTSMVIVGGATASGFSSAPEEGNRTVKADRGPGGF